MLGSAGFQLTELIHDKSLLYVQRCVAVKRIGQYRRLSYEIVYVNPVEYIVEWQIPLVLSVNF